MTPADLSERWSGATARRGGSLEAAGAVLSAIGMSARRWPVFWPEYLGAKAHNRNPPARVSATALLAEQDQADEAALAAAVAAAPELRATITRTYTREYWLEVYGGAARRTVARRQARYLAVVAAPGWVPDPRWRTSDVIAIATGILRTSEFSVTAILADALQEAGCDADGWLAALRDPAFPWFQGAPVLISLR
jgi:hypothetical protein